MGQNTSIVGRRDNRKETIGHRETKNDSSYQKNSAESNVDVNYTLGTRG